MLALAARQRHRLLNLPPAVAGAAQLQQERGIKLVEIFSKESRLKRREELKEEMQRGYFDDFRAFRDSKGKMFHATERLAPASHAPAFPRMQVVLPDGRPTVFPPAATAAAAHAAAAADAAESSSGGGGGGGSAGGGGALQPAPASLVCVAFRAGAQPMLEAWAGPFSQRFHGRSGVALYELAIVEGVVMRMWPFRQLLLRSAASGGDKYALPCGHLTHFGEMQGLRKALQLTNLLTGYVFLVDSQGRLRWRGSGAPSDPELTSLLRCTEELLLQEQQEHQEQEQG